MKHLDVYLLCCLVRILKRWGLSFFLSGSYSQIVEGVTEHQADLPYCVETDKDIPDLSIEIVITSGSQKKLEKYRHKGIPEV